MTRKIDTADFTKEQQNAFIEGWGNAGGYTDDLDDSPAPWCCPLHHGNTKIEVTGDDPKSWGALRAFLKLLLIS